MKNSILLLFSFAYLLILGCSKMSVDFMESVDSMEPIEYIPTPGVTAVVASPDRLPGLIRYTIEIFPEEIYLGDTIYLIAYGENISTEAVKNFQDSILPMYEYSPEEFTLLSTMIRSKYNWLSERPNHIEDIYGLQYSDLQPGEKRPYMMHYFEFPPLEDWDIPFWREMREKMTPEGVKCELHVTEHWIDRPLNEFRYEYYLKRCSGEITHEILIKSRPENEMVLLEQWYNATPEKLFPNVDGGCKLPHGMNLKSSGQSDIVINGKKFDPWLFIRLGNRKPSNPNNPTTLEGWRKLETSLIPSTMRDEVRLTRLQLEYYSAKKGKASDNAKTELVDWVKSLPEVQRMFMLNFLVGTSYYFAYPNEDYTKLTPLRDKSRELIRSLYDTLDVNWQKTVYSKDSTLPQPPYVQSFSFDMLNINWQEIEYHISFDDSLPIPEGLKVRRSMNEILEPAEEDLALKSKELPGGFRIWDAIGDTGETARMVAQFVELKESKDVLTVKHREGGNINLFFSKLTEEDKEYAREQSEKNSQTNNVSE